MTGGPPPPPPSQPRKKRGWGARLSEFLLWAVVALATCLLLVLLAERLLPENF